MQVQLKAYAKEIKESGQSSRSLPLRSLLLIAWVACLVQVVVFGKGVSYSRFTIEAEVF